jgi:hypothetical protein
MRLIALLILLPLISYSQKFELKQPDVKKIEAAVKGSDHMEDEVLIYLKQNYKALSKPTSVKRDMEFDGQPICSFMQKFEGGIEYFIDSCGEGKGTSVLLTLPKTDTAKLKKWIEKMYSINSTRMDNVWDKSGLIYQPEDEGAGCYYEIKQLKDKTVLDIYCGC